MNNIYDLDMNNNRETYKQTYYHIQLIKQCYSKFSKQFHKPLKYRTDLFPIFFLPTWALNYWQKKVFKGEHVIFTKKVENFFFSFSYIYDTIKLSPSCMFCVFWQPHLLLLLLFFVHNSTNLKLLRHKPWEQWNYKRNETNQWRQIQEKHENWKKMSEGK